MPEKFIPNVKLFLKKKKAKPITVRSERTADTLLKLIVSVTDIDVNKIARQAYVEFRSARGLLTVQRRLLGAILATRPSEPMLTSFITSWYSVVNLCFV